ncbi:MAG: hypothetical protein FWE35_15485 [Streptosporangiales bacterium]|jgi:hypothetical protein|nr:hypothetical protein [Streptosporangiales bacterium]
MADPLALAIAAAAAGKAAESMTEQAQQAIAVLVGKVRERLRRRPGGIPALDAAGHDEAEMEPLALVLEREFEVSPDFRDEVAGLWRQILESGAESGVSNVFLGKADKVVQVRDVQGDLTIN